MPWFSSTQSHQKREIKKLELQELECLGFPSALLKKKADEGIRVVRIRASWFSSSLSHLEKGTIRRCIRVVKEGRKNQKREQKEKIPFRKSKKRTMFNTKKKEIKKNKKYILQ